MFTSLNILIVEDEPIIQLQYQIYLTGQGFNLTCASSIQEAKQILQQESSEFDLVLLDNQLQDGEGIQLVPLIKEKMIYCAVLVISASTDPAFLLNAFSAGIDDYIIKPANLELLCLKVKSTTERLALKKLTDSQSRDLLLWKDNAQREQELASHLLKTMFVSVNQVSPAINTWIQPSELFSGDAIIQCLSLDGSIYVLLADAMGHGLAAAVSLMPLIQTFKTMATKGLPLSNVMFEVNKKLMQMLPEGRFVAAVALKIIPALQQIELWNGGLPSVLLLNDSNKVVERFSSENMPLGILDDRDISPHPKVFKYDKGAKLLFFTDGLVETPGKSGSFLDENIIIELVNHDPNDFSFLKRFVDEKLCKPEDDISLCYLDCEQFFHAEVADATLHYENYSDNGDVNCSYELKGSAVKTVDLPGLISSLLTARELPLLMVQRAFTVVTELYVNALEHGVLGLDSNLKQQEDGFLTYYVEKENRLKTLAADDCITLTMFWDSAARSLVFDIKDSGKGFVPANEIAGDEGQSFGRGIGLIRKLTTSFEIVPPGNQFRVVLTE